MLKSKKTCAKLINRNTMVTKERDGGSMEKKVEKVEEIEEQEEIEKVKEVVISPEGIEVVSISNGVKYVIQIDLEIQDEEKMELLEKYNLNDVKIIH